ncbi:MAG: YaiO family outer rane beta-barrel protein, partial [Bacteroidota bacterium]
QYSFIHFDKRFAQPWHLASMSYSKSLKPAYIGFNLNYANRFQKNATELELETYPKFKKGLYAYVGGAAKLNSNSLFPNYRLGFSLYQSLPQKFELETGLRHLAFDHITNVWVLGLGKYLGNSYLNLRSYWTKNESRWNESFILTAKFYLSDDRYDYWSLNAGTGVSFDDRTQINNVVYQLNSFRAGIDYSKNINPKTIVKAGFQWINEEYQNDTFGNQLGFNAGLQLKL